MCAQILALLEQDENSALVIESLNQSGHTVLAAANFRDAISMLEAKRLDAVVLIISDVHLENGGNVFDFLKWIRKNPQTEHTPFVMFSSRPTEAAKYMEDGLRTAARILGTSLYITMNIFDSVEFRRQIDSLLPRSDQTTSVKMEKSD